MTQPKLTLDTSEQLLWSCPCVRVDTPRSFSGGTFYITDKRVMFEPTSRERRLRQAHPWHADLSQLSSVRVELTSRKAGDATSGTPHLVLETGRGRESFRLRKYFRHPEETAASILQPLVRAKSANDEPRAHGKHATAAAPATPPETWPVAPPAAFGDQLWRLPSAVLFLRACVAIAVLAGALYLSFGVRETTYELIIDWLAVLGTSSWARHYFVAPTLRASLQGLVVRNRREVTRVPWGDIASVEPSQKGLAIARRSGGVVRADAVRLPPSTSATKRQEEVLRIASVLRSRAASYAPQE